MKLKRVPTIVFVMVCVALFTSSALGQTTQPADSSVAQAKPASEWLNKKRLLKLLTLNDTTQQELIQIVKQKGVDWAPFRISTFQVAANRKSAGASIAGSVLMIGAR